MKLGQVLILVFSLGFGNLSHEHYSILYNAYVEKNGKLKKIKCPPLLSCQVELSVDSVLIDDNYYQAFSFPEDGPTLDDRLKTFYRIEGNKFYFHSDFNRHMGISEILLFTTDRDTSTVRSVDRFYASGLVKFKLRQVSYKYAPEIKDTLHIYEILDYHIGISHYPLELRKLTFSKKYFFTELEYKYGSTVKLVQVK